MPDGDALAKCIAPGGSDINYCGARIWGRAIHGVEATLNGTGVGGATGVVALAAPFSPSASLVGVITIQSCV